MYERYHIETSPEVLPSAEIGKFKITRSEKCLNCGRCLNLCIYDVHKRDANDSRKMADPVSHLCKNCFLCVQNCPQQALAMVINEEFETLGNSYWTPQIIQTIWNEATEGKIPVYGAGYRGRFKGTGFDTIWTDMSEIVRPTRDGIHGREYIATSADLGRKLPWISNFKKFKIPNFHEIQIPMLFDSNPLNLNIKNITLAIIEAAHRLGTLALLDVENYFDGLNPFLKSIALQSPMDKIEGLDPNLLKGVRFIEITLQPTFSNSKLKKTLRNLKKLNPRALISLGTSTSEISEEFLKHFQEKSADILNFYADNQGNSFDGEIFISDSIRKLHLKFVQKRMRDEITIIGRGGIAAAEHVPKLIICGAEAVVLDLSLLVAMGCRICDTCDRENCPADIAKLETRKAEQRIINMTCAWRDQLLEILSAMGIRDIRRLRGEVGRAMFYEEIEKESFEFIFDKNGPGK